MLTNFLKNHFCCKYNSLIGISFWQRPFWAYKIFCFLYSQSHLYRSGGFVPPLHWTSESLFLYRGYSIFAGEIFSFSWCNSPCTHTTLIQLEFILVYHVRWGSKWYFPPNRQEINPIGTIQAVVHYKLSYSLVWLPVLLHYSVDSSYTKTIL